MLKKIANASLLILHFSSSHIHFRYVHLTPACAVGQVGWSICWLYWLLSTILRGVFGGGNRDENYFVSFDPPCVCLRNRNEAFNDLQQVFGFSLCCAWVLLLTEHDADNNDDGKCNSRTQRLRWSFFLCNCNVQATRVNDRTLPWQILVCRHYRLFTGTRCIQLSTVSSIDDSDGGVNAALLISLHAACFVYTTTV